MLEVKSENISELDGYPTSTKLVSSNGKFEFHIKWDGCSDMVVHYNDSTESNPTYHFDNQNWSSFHICDLREYIDMLEEAYKYALSVGYEY